VYGTKHQEKTLYNKIQIVNSSQIRQKKKSVFDLVKN